MGRGELDDAYLDGLGAFLSGKSYDACPFPAEDARATDWKRGWLDASGDIGVGGG